MKVKDLKNYLSQPFIDDEYELEIVLSEGGIAGPTPASILRSIEVGFDWNAGRILLYPTEDLIRKK